MKINKKKDLSPIRKLIEEYVAELKNLLDEVDLEMIEQSVSMVMDVYINRKNVFIVGNGGSASTSSHMACDLGKGTIVNYYNKKENRLHVVSLANNIALITAFANDLSFVNIFIQQMINLVQKGDLVIALSGSGNSKNVVKAVRYAKECGAKTIGLLGFNGGKLANLVDCPIIIRSNHYGPIEDIHVILNHIITACFTELKKEHDEVHNKK